LLGKKNSPNNLKGGIIKGKEECQNKEERPSLRNLIKRIGSPLSPPFAKGFKNPGLERSSGLRKKPL